MGLPRDCTPGTQKAAALSTRAQGHAALTRAAALSPSQLCRRLLLCPMQRCHLGRELLLWHHLCRGLLLWHLCRGLLLWCLSAVASLQRAAAVPYAMLLIKSHRTRQCLTTDCHHCRGLLLWHLCRRLLLRHHLCRGLLLCPLHRCWSGHSAPLNVTTVTVTGIFAEGCRCGINLCRGLLLRLLLLLCPLHRLCRGLLLRLLLLLCPLHRLCIRLLLCPLHCCRSTSRLRS